MDRKHLIKLRKLISLLICLGSASNTAFSASVLVDPSTVLLRQRPGFLRFSYDKLKMPNTMEDMGLMGLTYYADFTPGLYGGIGAYGSVTGTQGGLFVLGFGGGVHTQFSEHWWGDIGLFLGGGGGKSSLVGDGLMVRPHAGIMYAWKQARLGLHYSYISFPLSGRIHSHQIGLDLDLPFEFSYIDYSDVTNCPIGIKDILLCNSKYLDCERNDLAIILQSYYQHQGTQNIYHMIQDGTIRLIGAELDHYFSGRFFWWIKGAGAFAGIPNGYMDIIGGLGARLPFASGYLAWIPQVGVGAGGGGAVDTGGGIVTLAQLGFEVPLTSNFAARLSGGYLWAPGGELSAYTVTGALIYHLNIATSSDIPALDISPYFNSQAWRVHLFNQTYLRPQRSGTDTTTSAINLITFQIDQLFTPHFFLTYQGAFAYQGDRAGGYATGMIGMGIQTPAFMNNRLQPFAELLLGAGGGGGLALGGGALIEPVVGLNYYLTRAMGLQISVGQLRALQNDLNTTVFNLGITVRLGTLTT